MSVVDTVEILKGRALTEEEYFKAAVLGWGIELVRCLHLLVRFHCSLIVFPILHPILHSTPFSDHTTLNVKPTTAASFLPRLRRHDGRLDHAPRPAVLVPR